MLVWYSVGIVSQAYGAMYEKQILENISPYDPLCIGCLDKGYLERARIRIPYIFALVLHQVNYKFTKSGITTVRPNSSSWSDFKLQMRIPLEHFSATPVFALSPTTCSSSGSNANEERSGSPFSPSGNNSASNAATTHVFASDASSDSHGGQVGALASNVAIPWISSKVGSMGRLARVKS